MFEHQGEVLPLLAVEQAAYGVDAAQVVSGGGDSFRVAITLRGFATRPLVVTTGRENGHCVAHASTEIAGAEAQLDSIYVRLRWPLGVDYVLLQGLRRADGRWVQERIEGQD